MTLIIHKYLLQWTGKTNIGNTRVSWMCSASTGWIAVTENAVGCLYLWWSLWKFLYNHGQWYMRCNQYVVKSWKKYFDHWTLWKLTCVTNNIYTSLLGNGGILKLQIFLILWLYHYLVSNNSVINTVWFYGVGSNIYCDLLRNYNNFLWIHKISKIKKNYIIYFLYTKHSI